MSRLGNAADLNVFSSLSPPSRKIKHFTVSSAFYGRKESVGNVASRRRNPSEMLRGSNSVPNTQVVDFRTFSIDVNKNKLYDSLEAPWESDFFRCYITSSLFRVRMCFTRNICKIFGAIWIWKRKVAIHECSRLVPPLKLYAARRPFSYIVIWRQFVCFVLIYWLPRKLLFYRSIQVEKAISAVPSGSSTDVTPLSGRN